MNPQFPIYIPTKGRYETRMTMKALDEIGVPYRIVVESQERDLYVMAGIKPDRILVVPHHDQGLVVTRNWIWDHAMNSGTPWFWTMDDNIRGFYRLNHNKKNPAKTGTIFRAVEDFVQRYDNVAIAGLHYDFFAPARYKYPPFLINRRIYSNMLIKTDIKNPDGIPYRNEGFYNDDTDLCLRVLKDGWCTILFYIFLAKKIRTMTVAGGMTPYYQDDGRYKMAKELRDKHPDVVKIGRRYGRWQHVVDYRPFKKNRLHKKKDIIIPSGVNNYGMVLKQKESAISI